MKKNKIKMIMYCLFFYFIFITNSHAQCICVKPEESLFEYTTLSCIDFCENEFNHDWEFIPFGQRPAGWLDPFCVPDYMVFYVKSLFPNFVFLNLSNLFIRSFIAENLIEFYTPTCPSDIVRRCLLEDIHKCYENSLSGC